MAAVERELLEPLDDDAADEGRNALEASRRLRRPGQRRTGRRTVGSGAEALDERQVTGGLVRARRIFGEVVAGECERAGAAAAADPAVLATAAAPAELAATKLAEERGIVP